MKSLAARSARLMLSKEPIEAKEIAQAALELIRRHPSDAVVRAEARYEVLLSRGKVDRALKWWRVKREITELQSMPHVTPRGRRQGDDRLGGDGGRRERRFKRSTSLSQF